MHLQTLYDYGMHLPAASELYSIAAFLQRHRGSALRQTPIILSLRLLCTEYLLGSNTHGLMIANSDLCYGSSSASASGWSHNLREEREKNNKSLKIVVICQKQCDERECRRRRKKKSVNSLEFIAISLFSHVLQHFLQRLNTLLLSSDKLAFMSLKIGRECVWERERRDEWINNKYIDRDSRALKILLVHSSRQRSHGLFDI